MIFSTSLHNTNIKLNSEKNIISVIKHFNILVQNTRQLILLYENKENKLKFSRSILEKSSKIGKSGKNDYG
jgi:hypothetical protein